MGQRVCFLRRSGNLDSSECRPMLAAPQVAGPPTAAGYPANQPPGPATTANGSAQAGTAANGRANGAQGEVQKAFAAQADWEAVLAHLAEHPTVQEHYGDLLADLDPAAKKVLEVRTLVPLAKAKYAAKPGSLPAKRTGILNGYRSAAEAKGVPWRSDAQRLEALGLDFWESARRAAKRDVVVPEYYKACYEGPIHSYDRGNGEWMAAFDAPSAYLLVHLHHYPDVSPQEAFDALHEELDRHALEHLPGSGRPVRCLDLGCGVGTSTFSTARSLERIGRAGSVTGIDLSDYFVAVARYLQKEQAGEFNGTVGLEFLHGDCLDLRACGFEDAAVEMVTVSEVTHEMPKATSERLFHEVARVLVPGGVVAYMDLNPVQILRENAVGNLVDRIATSNEPYFDQYLELDVAASMRAAGLEVVKETWPNHAKYATLESCSLRMVIARKPPALTLATWSGRWALSRRENWAVYLEFLGVPPVAHEAATKAPDFHQYQFTESSFFMDHRIPHTGMHLRFMAFLDDQLQDSPYPRPTARSFDEKTGGEEKKSQWKHAWLEFPTSFVSTMPDFAGKGKIVTLKRELTSIDEIKYTVHVYGDDMEKPEVGPCYAWMSRTSTEPPLNAAAELKERFATGVSRPLEWRKEAIERVGKMILENVDAISAAQAEDHVSPSGFQGAAMMVRGAVAFYQANLESWAAPRQFGETLPPPMVTEGTWEVVPEPKGVGLVIAPWNAPVLLCALPLLGMLAAGNLCVLKPSEAAQATSKLLARLVQRYFPDRAVVVAEGGKEVVEQLIATPVDHVLFTGGGEVAKRILALAAPHLTPVSLELGGKNPCFVDADEPERLQLYAAEIVGTKSYFGGQFCQAHDYCLVHEKVFDDFVALLEQKISALGAKRRCQMINAAHARRVSALLEGQEHLARPPLDAGSGGSEDTVPLTVLVSPAEDSAVMRSEIFGPLLPVLRVSSAQEAADFIRRRPKPLVAYCYSADAGACALFQGATSSGNLAVNAGPQRMQSNFNVGFGGVGESGFGYSIWGRAAFDDYSHHRTVFNGRVFAGSVWGAAAPAAKQA